MSDKAYPIRKCISCGEHRLKQELIRIVRTDSGVLQDLSGKANGRGCYICKSGDCIKNARKARRIERALSAQVPDELYDSIQAQYTEEE